ncbi:MAG: M23 family metallopeptidase, partial [Rhodospirillales bacterium]
IDHGFGLSSVYIHMSEITVKNGDVVDRGQPIGAIGQTGRATGPHLHWGMSLFGTHIDPARLVGPMPQ